jgi:hypothetical protein
MLHCVSEQPDVFLVLIFPDSTESRWVWELPRIGSEMKSRLGKKWRVEEVMQSGTYVYTVHCGPPAHGLTAAQDLVADLLDRARDAASPTRLRKRKSFRWR